MNRFLDYTFGVLNFIFFFFFGLPVAVVILGLSPLARMGSFGAVMVALVMVPFLSVALFAFTQQPGARGADRRYLLALGILNVLPLVWPWPSLGILAWIVLLPYVLNLAYVVYVACRAGGREKRTEGQTVVTARR